MLNYNGFLINCLYDHMKKTFQAYVMTREARRKLLFSTGQEEEEKEALEKAMYYINVITGQELPINKEYASIYGIYK